MNNINPLFHELLKQWRPHGIAFTAKEKPSSEAHASPVAEENPTSQSNATDALKAEVARQAHPKRPVIFLARAIERLEKHLSEHTKGDMN